MKTRKAKQFSHSQSGRKAQVMSVDSILSYFLFALFLLLTSNYIINISKPFSSYVNYEIIYKNTESLNNEFLTNDVSREYLNQICNNNYTNVISTRANYETRAVILPCYDEPVNSSKLGVHLRREDNKLLIHYNTNTTTSIDYVLITSEEVVVNEFNTESNDDYNITRNENIVTITTLVNNTNNDADDYEIIVNNSVIIFLNNNNNTSMYLGTTPLSYSCGRQRNLAKKSYFTSYAVLEELNAVVSYGVEVWWE